MGTVVIFLTFVEVEQLQKFSGEREFGLGVGVSESGLRYDFLEVEFGEMFSDRGHVVIIDTVVYFWDD